MSESEIGEHAGYLTDDVRLAAYEAALRDVIQPGKSVVLDLGSGTGILGLLAARAGAKHVYSVDGGRIIATAQAIASASGFADRIDFIQKMSTDVSLPEPVDVVICDQIGGMVYDAGVLEYFADARKRLLAPDGVLLPCSFDLLAAPVESRDWADYVGMWNNQPAGFDFSPMFEIASNTEFRTEFPASDFLGQPEAWASVDSDHGDRIKGEVELVIERSGTINGIAGLFVANLTPSNQLSNCALRPERFDRWQNLYPLPTPVAVTEGDRVLVQFDVRPTTYLASWSVEVQASGQSAPIRSRGSTILGKFLTPADIGPILAGNETAGAKADSMTPPGSPLVSQKPS